VRAGALKGLITSMVDIYSSVVDVETRNTTQHLDGIIIRITLQTIECGIFILHYTSDVGMCFVLSYMFNGV